MKCPLCKHHGMPFNGDFLICKNCSGIYKHRSQYLSKSLEKARYQEHNNDVNDIRYRKFVYPITNYVLNNFTPHHVGLDFGAGTGPVISKVLQENQYNIHQFDPFFCNQVALLKKTYNYIVTCEVIEHFHNPDIEFELLHKMLKPKGALICMTHLYNQKINFKNWYYQNDPTHVFIYTSETIKFIANYYGFTDFTINNRLIILKA